MDTAQSQQATPEPDWPSINPIRLYSVTLDTCTESRGERLPPPSVEKLLVILHYPTGILLLPERMIIIRGVGNNLRDFTSLNY